MTSVPSDLVTRGHGRVRADPSRVVARLFVPGEEGFEHQDSRAGAVFDRIMALDADEVKQSLEDVTSRFGGRHRDLTGVFLRHAREVTDRLDPGRPLSDERLLLMGAAFTSEYAIEGAALCNPSIVAHPDQSGTAATNVRFVMSVRGIGEGHRSSIGFRTGVIDAAGFVTLDDPPAFATPGTITMGLRDEEPAHSTVAQVRSVAERTYRVEFDHGVPLSERVLLPATAAEAAGMEDARFVRFVDDDGSVRFLASYTAYSGSRISQQLLQTTDFRTFTSSPLLGSAAANKGLALFPRKIRGRFVAMSRSDRESNAIAFSDHPLVWSDSLPCQLPSRSWESLQLGNCGPPMETDAGWLVLTHGVGPMRTYRIGAILLDLEDPTRLIGHLREPLLSPASDERDGYVPNVVYTCGALVHADSLIVPYGMADAAIGIASVPLGRLLSMLTG